MSGEGQLGVHDLSASLAFVEAGMARRREEFRGWYYGLSSDGRVVKIGERYRNGSVILGGYENEHVVLRGRMPEREVNIVWHLTHVEFVGYGASELDKQRVVERLEAIARSEGRKPKSAS